MKQKRGGSKQICPDNRSLGVTGQFSSAGSPKEFANNFGIVTGAFLKVLKAKEC